MFPNAAPTGTVEEEPHGRGHGQGEQRFYSSTREMMDVSDITEVEWRIRRDFEGEITRTCRRKLGMDEIQALRASLANKQVSEEDCFMILEANPLGFHRHLEGDA